MRGETARLLAGDIPLGEATRNGSFADVETVFEVEFAGDVDYGDILVAARVEIRCEYGMVRVVQLVMDYLNRRTIMSL